MNKEILELGFTKRFIEKLEHLNHVFSVEENDGGKYLLINYHDFYGAGPHDNSMAAVSFKHGGEVVRLELFPHQFNGIAPSEQKDFLDAVFELAEDKGAFIDLFAC